LRTAFRTVLVVALAVGLFALFMRNANLAEVGAAVRTARMDLLVLGVLLALGGYVTRTVRWQYLLEPLGPTRFMNAFRATMLGFAASTVLPARAGEVLRPYVLARREGIDVAAAFATIVIERVLDLVAVLLMLAAYLVAFDDGVAARAPALYRAVTLGAWITTPVSLGLLGAMVVLAGQPARAERMLGAAERILPKGIAARVARLGRTFIEGLAIVRRPQRLLVILGWSLLTWGLISAETWAVARGFGISMPFTGAYLMTALLVVGVAIPTPGGVGGFHEAFRVGATSFFAADNDAAVAAALVLHVISFGPVLLLGIWAAAYEGLTTGRLKEMQRAGSERTTG
jgi:uncharacterized protein (TIRG00374 family)